VEVWLARLERLARIAPRSPSPTLTARATLDLEVVELAARLQSRS
jgi:hypothetical protein